MERSTTFWSEHKLIGQMLFWKPRLGIDVQIPTSIDYIRMEWEFGPDFAFNYGKDLA